MFVLPEEEGYAGFVRR